MKEYNIDPNEVGNVDEIPYKYLVYRFVGRQRRLERFKELKVPKTIIEIEQDLVQKAYNQMREKCLKDEEYKAHWEKVESISKA